MKKIEEVAFNRYLSDQQLPERKRMHPSNYLDGAELGRRESQRFIPIEEELPSIENGFLNKEVLTFTETKNGKGFYHLAIYTEGESVVSYNEDSENENCEEFLTKGWYQESEQINSEYDTVFISIEPTHWRPIERL